MAILTACCSVMAVYSAGIDAVPAQVAAWPAVRHGIPLRPDVERLVSDLLGRMTLEEKVGQMLQADVSSASPEDARRYGLGSVLAGGNSAPKRNLRGPASDWLELARQYAEAATGTKFANHAAIPLLFGVDAVHGHGHARGATIFPHNVGLGATRDAALIRRIGAATADEVRATGIDWVFAPTVAVALDSRWGRAYESYSDDPQLVAEYASAMVSGLQAPNEATGVRLAATIKHFLGDGGTLDGRDQGQTQADEAQLIRLHAPGYAAGIRAGALTVMASYSSWNGQKMHENRVLLTDVLKGRMGFNGFVIGDWNGHEQIGGCTKFDCPAAILAGVDMVMAADGWLRFRNNTIAEVRSGAIPLARIDDAVRRILRVKVELGLFAGGNAAQRARAADLSVLGAPAHRAVAREAVRRSLVLLKNDHRVLPLAPSSHVLVTGPAADDLGVQCGGWTVDWQGDHNRNEDFPGGTSIYTGLRNAMVAAGGSAEYSADGSFVRRPDVAVVVFGERPYAEFDGDRESLRLDVDALPGLTLIRSLRAQGIPVVAVLLSGRPLWINRELNAADALVAAWLPGTEGEGVADVLVAASSGAARYDFTGRLPFPWPATARPVRRDADGQAKDALYARGYGLDYRATAIGSSPPLAEEDGLGSPDTYEVPLFADGHVIAPLTLYLQDAIGDLRDTMPVAQSQTQVLRVSTGPGGATARWTGAAPAELLIAGRAHDLSRAADANKALKVTYRVTEPPAGKVRLGVRCGLPYGVAQEGAGVARHCGLANGAMGDFTAAFRRDPGQWHELTLPLRCFVGADLRIVGAPFALQTDGPFEVTFSRISLVDGSPDADECAISGGEDRVLVAPPN